jgi:ABC-2 type transport system permease protein
VEPPSFERLFSTVTMAGRAANDPIAYYAGAVAVLFLLLSAVQGGATLLEEKESGVLDRIISGPGGLGVFVDGKCAFITALGVVQVALIFGIAWAVHGVSLAGSVLPWLAITLLAAWSAAGLALLLAALCNSRRQVLTLGNFVVLVLSAIGGSMVPRFLMPGWLQDAGWITPNTWALEAYDATVRLEQPIDTVLPSLTVLFVSGLVGWAGARIAARRFERL